MAGVGWWQQATSGHTLGSHQPAPQPSAQKSPATSICIHADGLAIQHTSVPLLLSNLDMDKDGTMLLRLWTAVWYISKSQHRCEHRSLSDTDHESAVHYQPAVTSLCQGCMAACSSPNQSPHTVHPWSGYILSRYFTSYQKGQSEISGHTLYITDVISLSRYRSPHPLQATIWITTTLA